MKLNRFEKNGFLNVDSIRDRNFNINVKEFIIHVCLQLNRRNGNYTEKSRLSCNKIAMDMNRRYNCGFHIKSLIKYELLNKFDTFNVYISYFVKMIVRPRDKSKGFHSSMLLPNHSIN